MQCNHCKEKKAGYYCSGCSQANYCSVTCQQTAWIRYHNKECIGFELIQGKRKEMSKTDAELQRKFLKMIRKGRSLERLETIWDQMSPYSTTKFADSFLDPVYRVVFLWDVQSTGISKTELEPGIRKMINDGYKFLYELGKGSQFGTVWAVEHYGKVYAAKFEMESISDMYQGKKYVWTYVNGTLVKTEEFRYLRAPEILPIWHATYPLELSNHYCIVVMENMEEDIEEFFEENDHSEKREAIEGLIEKTERLGFYHDDIQWGNILAGPTDTPQNYNTYTNSDGRIFKVVWGDASSLSESFARDGLNNMMIAFREAFLDIWEDYE